MYIHTLMQENSRRWSESYKSLSISFMRTSEKHPKVRFSLKLTHFFAFFSIFFWKKEIIFSPYTLTGSTRRFHEFLGGRSLDSTPCPVTALWSTRDFIIWQGQVFFHSKSSIQHALYEVVVFLHFSDVTPFFYHTCPVFSTTGRPRILWT